MQRIQHFIDGAFVGSTDGRTLPLEEPATGAIVGEVADGGEIEVAQAVQAARRAFAGWSSLPPWQRGRILLQLADLIDRDREALARAESIDSGKPIALARSVEIPRAAANLRFFAQLAMDRGPEVVSMSTTLPGAAPGSAKQGQVTSEIHRRAAGVAACISPWNLPLYLFTWKIAPALAAGCTVVGKPSEVTPVTASMLCKLAAEAGIPKGVLNVVQGRAGAALVQHPGVARIGFTGGTATGRLIAQAAARHLTPLSLELGGKNATIVMEDAPASAVDGAVRAAFQNQGQICLCGSRILVQQSIAEDFRAKFVERARALQVGDPLDESTQQGALVSAAHLAKVTAALARAREEGGKIECGGGAPERLPLRVAGGHFFAPTVISGLAPSSSANQEEIFGPVATIIPFRDEQEAVEIANGVGYGLAASVWSSNAERARRIAARLDVGTVWVNSWLVRDLRVPFGGWKDSGIGREGGLDALHFYCEPTVVCSIQESGAQR